MNNRVEKMGELIEEQNLDAILVYSPSNRRYLTGFAGSTGYAVITKEETVFLVDFRYQEQAQKQCPGWSLVSIKGEPDVFTYLKEHGMKHIGVEKDFVTLRFYEALKSVAEVGEIQDVSAALAEIRMIKDEGELKAIKRACEITDLSFEYVLTQIKEGMTEAEIDCIIQGYMRKFPEVDRIAERFIVASGERGALPHGIASERKVQMGDMITIDFGCSCYGYWSDVTRTICLGKGNDKQKEIYQIVLEAQEAALAAVKAGKTGREIDTVARDYIKNAGYGEYFGHGLGHSFGIDIHENPRCAQNAAGDMVLEPGMIMTIEPGIYIPGFGGVRIEDDIIVTEDGHINLTGAPKYFIEL